MSTAIGVIVSVVVTVLVSRYYFRRSTRKSLKAYLLVNSHIFEGIEPDVREQLRFTFRGEEVKTLQQIEFLVANGGERAISGLIEPLQLKLPSGVRVLDAVILHRHPERLAISVSSEGISAETDGPTVTFGFPLLNKMEYFLVKILLAGSVSARDLSCTLLGDDLPRSIPFEWVPWHRIAKEKPKVEWPVVVVSLVIMMMGISIVFATLPTLLFGANHHPFASRPILFYPLFILAIASGGLLAALGALICMAGFEGLFRLGPRFPIPEGLRQRHSLFDLEREHLATETAEASKRQL